MLLSLAIIILLGFALQGLLSKIKLPGLLGFLLAGLILSPFALNLIAPEILNISADLRKIALIVILVRAGLALDIRDLRRVGRPAILLGFVPALLEIGGITLLGTLALGLPLLEAALLGTAIAAVSPAIVIPSMLRLMESGRGRDKHIPQMIMAGATVDNIFVLVFFTILLAAATGGTLQPEQLVKVPLSIVTGLVVGILIGILLSQIFKILHMRDTIKVMLILGMSFLLVGAEGLVSTYVSFSGILAVVALAVCISDRCLEVAPRLSGKFAKVWVAAELILFVLVGAMVDIRTIGPYILPSLALIAVAVLCRTIGVLASTARTGLNTRERLFCAIACLPKASLQAVLGALPLAAGLGSGQLILSAAILAILLTAPLGAIGIEKTNQRLLERKSK